MLKFKFYFNRYIKLAIQTEMIIRQLSLFNRARNVTMLEYSILYSYVDCHI